MTDPSSVSSSESFLEALFAALVEQARSAIGAHQAVASLTLGPDWSQTIVALSLSDKYGEFRAYNEKPQGTGIYTLVCRQNRPMRLTQGEIEAHPAWQNFGAEKGRHPPMRGWLAVPLVGMDGRNLGLVQLSDKYEGEFTAEDEAKLIQLAQLAAAATENARLVAAVRRMTHDFNNLLTVVNGFAELLQAPTEPSGVRAFAKEIKEAGQRASALVREFREECGLRSNDSATD
jgi:GAF domain-containing protein